MSDKRQPLRHPGRIRSPKTRHGLGAALALVLAACQSGPPSPASGCAYVDPRHLAVPRNVNNKPLICDPQLVAPAQRARYFPDYTGGVVAP